MVKRALSLIAVVLFTSSCSIYHISSENTSDEFYPEKPADEVIYLENIEDPHQTIGMVTVNAERRQSLNDVIVKMKREAAILGGNAISDIRTDATGLWKTLPAQQMIGNAYVRANFTATVILLEGSHGLEETPILSTEEPQDTAE